MILSNEEIISLKSQIISIGYHRFGNVTESFLNDALSGGTVYKVFGSFENGVLTGFLILSIVSDEAEIIQVAVKTGFSRLGIGSSLVKDAVFFSMHNGVSEIFLEVRASNEPAVRTYLKNGFEKVGVRKSYYSDPVEDAVMMSKRICRECR
jgi:[ribosomal protein S18]-alanine N-acetyltransferase